MTLPNRQVFLVFRPTEDRLITCIFCERAECEYETKFFSRSTARVVAGGHKVCFEQVHLDWRGRPSEDGTRGYILGGLGSGLGLRLGFRFRFGLGLGREEGPMKRQEIEIVDPYRRKLNNNPVARCPAPPQASGDPEWRGPRTELWRHLSYAVGDTLATRCCLAVYLVLRFSKVRPERVERGWPAGSR